MRAPGTVIVFLDPDFPDGRVADATKPQLMATDQGATRGDGVFETLLVTGGQPRALQAHLDRLERSAGILELDLPAQDRWRAAIATAITTATAAAPETAGARTAGAGTAGPETAEPATPAPGTAVPGLVVKLLVTRGVEGAATPTAWVQAGPAPVTGKAQREKGLEVILLDRGYDSTLAERAPWLLLGAKTLSYAVNMATLRYAKSRGADDVIFTSTDGKVLEGPTSTVVTASVRGGVRRLSTPLLESGILPGTTQGSLFGAARAAGWELGYGPLEPADLFAADGVWLVSSVRLLAPVNTIDGRSIGTPPELTAELSSLLARAQA